MIIDSPTISPKLSSKEKVRERNDYKEDNNVEKFTHDKLPKVYVVVMHDTLKKGCAEVGENLNHGSRILRTTIPNFEPIG